MILRIWIGLLVVIVGGAWLLMIPFSRPPEVATGTVINAYRAMGMVPEANGTTVSDALGHDVFEVPKEDAARLKMAMESMSGMKMGDMKMTDMKMKDMPGMKMDMPKEGGESAKQAMPGMKMGDMKMKDMPSMKMGDMEMKDMPGMKMEMPKEAEEAEGHGGGGVAEGLTVIAQGSTALIEHELAEKGLKVDVTMTIDMKEWGFSRSMVMAQPGQVVRLKVKNTGNLPHEFMLMNGPAMSAVDYRLRRADWNLLEHEALTEVPFVMPGDSFEMVIQIHKSGVWMYMCMFPYHMQLGMMGMLMTPDMMGKMGPMMGMSGMKM